MSPSTLTVRYPRPLVATCLMAAGIVAFALAALTSLQSLKITQQRAEQRAAAYQSLVQLESVLSELKDVETGQRGFLMTGNERFLEPYVKAQENLGAGLDTMQNLMRDMELPPDYWSRLRVLVKERISIAEKNIDIRRKSSAEVFDATLLTEGKRAMDAIRREFGQLEERRRREIAQLTADLAQEQRSAYRITLGAGLFGFALMLTSLGLFLREQHLRLKAEEVLAGANMRLEAAVATRTSELQTALTQIRAFAGEMDQQIEAERRRLAREVHDQVGQIFTALKLLVRPWRDRFTAETELQTQFAEFSRLMDEGVSTARRITAELQPPLLEELGLGAALEHYFTKMGAAAGLSCRVETRFDHLLERKQATALFRIAQEILTNTLRHAEAKRITITDNLTGAIYCLTVEDDGRGLSNGATPSFGMRGMEERAKLAGGSLSVSTRPEGGLRVQVTVPVKEHEVEATP